LLNLLIMFISVTVICYAILGYIISFHNLDLSYNMALLANDINNFIYHNNMSEDIHYVNYRDMSDDYQINKSATYIEFYIFSASRSVKFLLVGIMGGVIFGITFFYNVTMYEFKEKLRRTNENKR